MKTLNINALLIAAVITFSSCNAFRKQQAVQKLSPVQFQQSLESARGTLIDVRTPAEFDLDKIAGAVNINVHADDFKQRIAALDKHKAFFIYCENGMNSTLAINLMKKNGFKYLFELQGGLIEWKKQNMPVVTIDDEASEVIDKPRYIGAKRIIDYSDGTTQFRREINENCDTSWQIITTIPGFTGIGKFTSEYAYQKGLAEKEHLSHGKKQKHVSYNSLH